MRLKFVPIILILAFASAGLFAQTEPHAIKFEEPTHNFGDVTQGDKTEFTFKFTNTSPGPITLKNVKASCGCTTPKWTREEVAPGATGDIRVTYNSNRIGPFNKSVRINYNDRTDPVMIYIKGKVAAKEGTGNVVTPPKPVIPQIAYNIPRGALAFERIIENIKNISSEETKEVSYRFKNTSSLVVKILNDESKADAGVTFKVKDILLKPGEETVVNAKIDGKALKADGQADGYFSKVISIYTDEAQGAKKQLTINGSFKRIFTESERSSSPSIEFETVNVDGGKIIEGEKFVFDFKFKNKGGGPLKISSAKASCGCTATKPPGEAVAPGDEAAITVTFNSKGRVGRQSKSVTVKSNDIENPTTILKFTVEVVKDPFHAGSLMGGSK